MDIITRIPTLLKRFFPNNQSKAKLKSVSLALHFLLRSLVDFLFDYLIILFENKNDMKELVKTENCTLMTAGSLLDFWTTEAGFL